MSFGSFNSGQPQAMMSDINVTPMVDVMLVLLVIFIMTAPLFTHRLQLALPVAGAAPAPEQVASVTIAIDAAGAIYLEELPVTREQLGVRLAAAAAALPQPEVQLRADKNTRYEVVAQVMSAAQSHGLTKLAFITTPQKEKNHGKR